MSLTGLRTRDNFSSNSIPLTIYKLTSSGMIFTEFGPSSSGFYRISAKFKQFSSSKLDQLFQDHVEDFYFSTSAKKTELNEF